MSVAAVAAALQRKPAVEVCVVPTDNLSYSARETLNKWETL
jgi:hypothetical protein